MDVISRRAALVRGGLALAAVSPLLRAATAAAGPKKTPQVWKLVPSRTCKACSACKSHGHNKLFATAVAADQSRAHQGCKCRVRRTRTVSPQQRAVLFQGDGKGNGLVADKRWPWVAKVMRSSAVS
jgi:hypothetical protein